MFVLKLGSFSKSISVYGQDSMDLFNGLVWFYYFKNSSALALASVA